MTSIFDITTEDFSDNLLERSINVAIIVGWAFVLVFVAANIVPTLDNVAEATRILVIFVTMFLIYLFAWTNDAVRDIFKLEVLPIAVIGVRGLFTRAIPVLSAVVIVSLWVGFFMVAARLGIAVPQSVGFDQFTDTLYRAVNAPLGEEFFFRAFLIPTLALLITVFTPIKRYLIALAIAIPIVSAAFAATHFFIFGGNIALATVSFVWGIISGILLVAAGILATIAFHLGNNLPIQFGAEGAAMILVFITSAIIGLNILAFLALGRKRYFGGRK